MSSSRSGSENENANAGIPFSKRDIKSNPVMRTARQTPDEARERRRGMFMRKVEQGREEKQWRGRSEQILRSDYLAQRRKWEQERDREAHLYYDDVADFEDDEKASGSARNVQTSWPVTPRLQAQPDDTAEEVDEIAQMEEEELRAMLEMQEAEAMQMSFQTQQTQSIPSSPTRYGSDDEDYDDIFMELLSSQQVGMGLQTETRPHPQQQYQHQQDEEMMDTT